MYDCNHMSISLPFSCYRKLEIFSCYCIMPKCRHHHNSQPLPSWVISRFIPRSQWRIPSKMEVDRLYEGGSLSGGGGNNNCQMQVKQDILKRQISNNKTGRKGCHCICGPCHMLYPFVRCLKNPRSNLICIGRSILFTYSQEQQTNICFEAAAPHLPLTIFIPPENQTPETVTGRVITNIYYTLAISMFRGLRHVRV